MCCRKSWTSRPRSPTGRLGLLGDFAEKQTLAHAAAAEDAHALSLAAGEQRVDSADAGRQRFGDAGPVHGAGGFAVNRTFLGADDGALSVNRAIGNSGHVREGHQEGTVVAESDDLGINAARVVRRRDFDHLTD